jgi:hypothetical protein
MRLLASAAAALLLLAVVTSWGRPPQPLEPATVAPPVGNAGSDEAEPAPARTEPVADASQAEPGSLAGDPSAERGAVAGSSPAPAVPAADTVAPAADVPVLEPIHVIELAERADFEEAPLAPDAGASAGAGQPAPEAPGSAGLERSGDLVRRMLSLYEAMRE